MIKRYAHPEITRIFDDQHRVGLWQKTELAVIEARVNLRRIDREIFTQIFKALSERPCDLTYWRERENKIQHDLQAWVDERIRFIPVEFQRYWHQGMTSYDTEEAPFSTMIQEALEIVRIEARKIEDELSRLALRYRFTPMIERTHGQWAELISFGKRCLGWFAQLRFAMTQLESASGNLKYSRLSGAVGNYSGIDPELEREALRILHFEPFYGATQILPRIIHAPIAQALANLVAVINNISLDIRLGARSGRPICQEPFKRIQVGSSAMPHKKNTIVDEKIEGMVRMARSFARMIEDNITTWEGRAIEQSCVERVAWPDLFHVTLHSLECMVKILKGLQVYPDQMMVEITESRGTYATSVAKEILKELAAEHLPSRGLTPEDCYRMLQLAAANAFEPSAQALELREQPPASLAEAQTKLQDLLPLPEVISIQTLVLQARLRTSNQLAADADTVARWNRCLAAIFESRDAQAKWNEVFEFEYLLRNEGTLYEKILGK